MRRRPVGLRTMVMLAFAALGLLVSATLALGTYLVARNYLIDQRERSATRQAFADASFVRDGLLTSGAEVSDVLGAVSPPAGATVLVHRGDRWFSSSLDVGSEAIHGRIQRYVLDGDVALAWDSVAGSPAVTVGVPLPAVEAQFFEISSTNDFDRTLDTLRVVLGAGAIVTAVGSAFLGRWAARRVVAPLDEVAGAAARIAGGALDTRLPDTEDPDLVGIVGSFNSMVDAVHERIERDARFAADVSHELRSPLTALVTSVDVLQRRRDQLPERSQQALDLIARDLGRFQRALEDLLELGRLEAGHAAQIVSTVDLRDIVVNALDASGRPTSLLCDGQPDGHAESRASTVVTVDKQQINRALVNLFDNADRHGGGLTAVTVTGTASGVSVTVDDAGPGVDPADRERIFSRFVRGGSRGSLPGTGLGLSLVAETARAHGGAVWCTSGPDGGARFVVRLPRGAPQEVGIQ